MSEQAPLLSVRDLCVSFMTGRGEVTAVSDVNFDVLPGETVAVVGESGSGKSTIAASINGLLAANGRIASGSVTFAGEDLTAANDRVMTRIRGAGIGLVPQDPMSNLDPLKRIGAQIVETLVVHKRAKGAAAKALAIDLLSMVGIADPARRFGQYPHEFSGGMRQRVLIAIALACRPQLLIADEPTSALDVTVQRTILDQLEALTHQMGTAVFLITHDLALAAERADRVIVMRNGRMVEQGRADEVINNPREEYTRKLLAAAPSLHSASIHLSAPAALAADNPPLVRFESVMKSYPIRNSPLRRATAFTAVDEVSFTIPRGQTVAIVGESGSGKSTTARMLLKLEKINGGRILFDGDDISAQSAREQFVFRRRVQPVFQNPYASLDSRYSIGDAIEEPLVVHGIGTAASRTERVAMLLERVALPAALRDRYPHELSGGQRQRVAIARALALEPELVVLDEAVSALDVIVQAQILDLLAELQKDLGLSYLFISHDLAVVKMISHQVHVLRRGRLVESGTPAALFSNPQEEYTKALIEAIPGRALAAM